MKYSSKLLLTFHPISEIKNIKTDNDGEIACIIKNESGIYGIYTYNSDGWSDDHYLSVELIEGEDEFCVIDNDIISLPIKYERKLKLQKIMKN